MNKLFKRFMDIFTVDDDDLENDNSHELTGAGESPVPFRNGKLEVSIMSISSYDEVEKVTNRLKLQQAVIADISRLPADERTRTVDFICGTIYALNGNLHKITEDLFFFAPSFVTFHIDRSAADEKRFLSA
ncbi:MAG: cell division protein SepF [Candidatus Wallbacteria bacterium]|nr:cell division protein SepF [Candidatus Wallbacteria bacterium]